jgi:hypothetical protein
MPQRPTIWRAIRGQLLDVGLGAGGEVAEDDLLGDAAAERDLDLPSRWRSSKLKRSASGAEKVTPSAIPRGMIETLRTGSAPGVSMPTIAWPASW